MISLSLHSDVSANTRRRRWVRILLVANVAAISSLVFSLLATRTHIQWHVIAPAGMLLAWFVVSALTANTGRRHADRH